MKGTVPAPKETLALRPSQRSNFEGVTPIKRVELNCSAALLKFQLPAPVRLLPPISRDGKIALICQQIISMRYMMKHLCVAALLSLFAASPALAQEGAACAAKAVGKDGKALAGAAKASSMKKCCETSAVGKDGNKLAGAAKTSFMKKCEAGT